eukprot:CAMPEP_0197464306 /NCGR_PEP_ID=MMETSP1175-20131217/63952_1 /TAXON_ID=1003142 /ORGANISM="Triceratium dubium, Strain CCMP147" /LENGTH=236 /DNA_ID=CAMNT_0043000281 /DNA_START=169 /DNA_END=879 /DNA_ORIENTATION=+
MSKHIVLLRHGESEGQQYRGKARRYPNLLDSYLTKKGEKQARVIPSFLSDLDIAADFDLICTSPLTRAIATCVLGFGHLHERVPIVCHPDLAEVGGSVPENQARPLKKVLRDLKRRYRNNPVAVSATRAIDFSLLPSDWPSNGASSSASEPSFLEWLRTRKEVRIAVVCHHNVILQKLLCPGAVARVPNCVPISCQLPERDQSGGGNKRLELTNASHSESWRASAKSKAEVKNLAY